MAKAVNESQEKQSGNCNDRSPTGTGGMTN